MHKILKYAKISYRVKERGYQLGIADKQQVLKLLKSNFYTAYALNKKIDNQMSRAMLERYMNGAGNPKYTGEKKAEIGKLTLDNAITLTKVANESLGSNMKTKERIQEEIQQLETMLEITDGKEKVIELKTRIDALQWVLEGSEPTLIF